MRTMEVNNSPYSAIGKNSTVNNIQNLVQQYGLNEEAVNALLTELSSTLSSKISAGGEKVTEDVAEVVSNIVGNKFVELVCQLEEKQKESEDSIIHAVQQNFADMQSDVTTLADDIVRDLKKIDTQNETFANLLDRLNKQYEKQADVNFNILDSLSQIQNKVEEHDRKADEHDRKADEYFNELLKKIENIDKRLAGKDGSNEELTKSLEEEKARLEKEFHERELKIRQELEEKYKKQTVTQSKVAQAAEPNTQAESELDGSAFDIDESGVLKKFKLKDYIGEVKIPECVTSIGDRAFYSCSKITSVVLDGFLKRIGCYAFSGCSNLVKISISGSIGNIDKYAFQHCSSLTNVIIENATSTGLSDDCSHVYTEEGSTVLRVANIGEGVFNGCSNLTRVSATFAKVSISDNLFRHCSKLAIIDFPYNTDKIGSNSFRFCIGLIKVVLPKGVKCIEHDAFADCYNLTLIDIPKNVTYIGSNALKGCSRLGQIYFNGSKKQWKAIQKDSSWDLGTGNYVVHCSNGDISKY